MAATKPTSIAIIGAGPAGLTFARLLLVSTLCSTSNTNRKISITIFELDKGAHSRVQQGESLDLHPETGQLAVKTMGLWDEFMKYARYEGEEMVVADKHGTQILHLQEQASSNLDSRPEIGREQLKDILLSSVIDLAGEGGIQWGRQLASIDDKGVLHFKDNTTEGPFDLVVCADGAFSKVRPVLTSTRPHYSGICGFEIGFTNPRQNMPRYSSMSAAASSSLPAMARPLSHSGRVMTRSKCPPTYCKTADTPAPCSRQQSRRPTLRRLFCRSKKTGRLCLLDEWKLERS